MDDYAGIGVSLELSSAFVLDGPGQICNEAKVTSEPEALETLLAGMNLPLIRVGLESGGFKVALLETQHVKAALLAMIVKIDRGTPAASLNSCAWADLGHPWQDATGPTGQTFLVAR